MLVMIVIVLLSALAIYDVNDRKTRRRGYQRNTPILDDLSSGSDRKSGIRS